MSLKNLKLGGLTFPSIIGDVTRLVGPQLTTLKIETVHFDISLEEIGTSCLNLEELHVINARLKTKTSSHSPATTPAERMFAKLKFVYFFLVQCIGFVRIYFYEWRK